MKLYLTYGQEAAPEGFEKQYPEDFLASEAPVSELVAHQVLDKLPKLVSFFESLYAYLAPDSKATFSQYYYRTPMAYVSPLTVRGISEHSLSWLNKKWREDNTWAAFDTGIDFDVTYGVAQDPSLENRSEDAKTFAMANYASSITSIQFVVTKK